MKNINLLLLGAAAIGGFYLYNRSKKELPTGDNTDFDELELRVSENESRVSENESSIISNTDRIGSTESSLANALEGQISIDDIDLSGVYTKEELNSILLDKADANNVYTKLEADELLNTKQPEGNYIYESYFDEETDLLKDDLEAYADDIKDGIEVQLSNDFYSKSAIDSGFQVKGNYVDEGYVDDAMDEAKDYADAEDTILQGELETFATNKANTAQQQAANYSDTRFSDLESDIEDGYAQLDDLPIMSNYATMQYVNTGLQGKQAAGDYVDEGYVDQAVDDALEAEDFLTLQQAENNFYQRDLGDLLGNYVLGANDYPVYANNYAPSIYAAPPNTSGSASANFSGFRFSAW